MRVLPVYVIQVLLMLWGPKCVYTVKLQGLIPIKVKTCLQVRQVIVMVRISLQNACVVDLVLLHLWGLKTSS